MRTRDLLIKNLRDACLRDNRQTEGAVVEDNDVKADGMGRNDAEPHRVEHGGVDERERRRNEVPRERPWRVIAARGIQHA